MSLPAALESHVSPLTHAINDMRAKYESDPSIYPEYLVILDTHYRICEANAMVQDALKQISPLLKDLQSGKPLMQILMGR